jgi:hypothetical protein
VLQRVRSQVGKVKVMLWQLLPLAVYSWLQEWKQLSWWTTQVSASACGPTNILWQNFPGLHAGFRLCWPAAGPPDKQHETTRERRPVRNQLAFAGRLSLSWPLESCLWPQQRNLTYFWLWRENSDGQVKIG